MSYLPLRRTGVVWVSLRKNGPEKKTKKTERQVLPSKTKTYSWLREVGPVLRKKSKTNRSEKRKKVAENFKRY